MFFHCIELSPGDSENGSAYSVMSDFVLPSPFGNQVEWEIMSIVEEGERQRNECAFARIKKECHT